MSSSHNLQHNMDHLWHVWINRRQEGRHDDWEGNLYEFKHMLEFLRYGHEQLEKAFEKRLPVLHQQCSRTAPEPIKDNRLTCCLGQEVTACPILLSLKETIVSERERKAPWNGEQYYSNVDDRALYRLMAQTCAWHIYHDACGIQDGHHFHCDTSEGYLLDKSDRMFWDRVYSSMAGSDPDSDAGEEPK